MSSSSRIYKSSFIKFTGENTRIIDSSALVAKRMEGFTGVLREQDESAEAAEPQYDEEGNIIEPSSIDVLTGDAEFSEGESGEEGEDFSAGIPRAQYTPTKEDVQAELDEMLAKASAEAERIIEDAKAEADSIRASAKEEGYQSGRDEALAELLEAKAQFEKEGERLEEEYTALLKDAEPKMVDVITDVYEKVFGDNFYSRRDVMVCLLNKALMDIETTEQVIIHVSPKDYDMLVGMKASIFEKTPLKTEPEINQREDYEKGQAKIETPFGIIDCSIDTELKELKRALTVLSYGGNS